MSLPGDNGPVEVEFWIVTLAVVVLAGTAIANRWGVSAPLLLTAIGIAGSYLPGMPEFHLPHDVVLFGLLPPLLYAASVQTSLVDFNANRAPILLLSVGLVVFTAAGVALVVHAIIPEIGWGASFAIGAVVAPPDAVAATAIARRIGLPRRIVTVLEGESLLNDATALVTLRTALAAMGAGVSFVEVGVDFVIAAGGGALVGLVTFLVVGKIRSKVTDPLLDTGVSFVVPFAAYLAAETIHASGVIAVVVAGLLLGHKAPIIQTARSRIVARINWRTIAYLLENTVFLLIGYQADWIIREAFGGSFSAGRIVVVCLATLVVVMVLRLVWVLPTRMLLDRPTADEGNSRPPLSYALITGWAGMRGVVTLAAAFLIPNDAHGREVLLLVAMTVVAGTLFLQGSSLPWLARRLQVPSPDPAADALARATLLQHASKAGLDVLEAMDRDDPHDVTSMLRQRLDTRNFAAWERLATRSGEDSPSEFYARARREMIQAERKRVLEIRATGKVPSDVIAEVLELLDLEESMLESSQEQRDELHAHAEQTRPGGICADLESHPIQVTTADAYCPECLEEGTRWVALRQCLDCGHVGCCDSSPGQHATHHFWDTRHPVMESAEPGEEWRWCYLHHTAG